MRRILGTLLALAGVGCNSASRGPVMQDAGSGNTPPVESRDAALDASPGPDVEQTAADSGQPAAAADSGAGADAQAGAPGVALPPANAPFDYQLGGAYPPPQGVRIVSRDRTESPAAGLYNICYVNGFQVQPGEEGDWDADLILRNNQGQPVVDPDWDEQLLDVSTADKRSRIADKLSGFIAGCAGAGFDAVEIDNLDSYARSGGRLSMQNAVDLMKLLSAAAHQHGLAIAQKNSTELLDRRAEMATDFAVAEECSRYSECADYVAAYGEHVLMIEYRRSDFEAGCQSYGGSHAIVLRDLDLVPQGDSAYVFDGC